MSLAGSDCSASVVCGAGYGPWNVPTANRCGSNTGSRRGPCRRTAPGSYSTSHKGNLPDRDQSEAEIEQKNIPQMLDKTEDYTSNAGQEDRNTLKVKFDTML